MYSHVRQVDNQQPGLKREHRLSRDTHATREPAGRARTVARAPAGPRRYKLALLTWGSAYAVITLILAVLGPTMAAWPLGLRTFVLSVLMVFSLTWLIMPVLTRLFRTWLTPTA
jgi:antibiotic biosynthesis monooxygenase (ABM) superfamily enzyme